MKFIILFLALGFAGQSLMSPKVEKYIVGLNLEPKAKKYSLELARLFGKVTNEKVDKKNAITISAEIERWQVCLHKVRKDASDIVSTIETYSQDSENKFKLYQAYNKLLDGTDSSLDSLSCD